MVVGWGRNSYLGPVEVSSSCVSGLMQGHRVGLRFYLVVSDLDENEDFMYKSVGTKMLMQISSFIFSI